MFGVRVSCGLERLALSGYRGGGGGWGLGFRFRVSGFGFRVSGGGGGGGRVHLGLELLHCSSFLVGRSPLGAQRQQPGATLATVLLTLLYMEHTSLNPKP